MKLCPFENPTWKNKGTDKKYGKGKKTHLIVSEIGQGLS